MNTPTGGGVVSLTCRVLGTIVGVLEVEGLTNLTFAILGVVTSSEQEVIITLTTGISIGIFLMKILLIH